MSWENNSALKNSIEEAFIESEKHSTHINVLDKKTQILQVKLANTETETRVAKEEAIS